MGKEAIISGGSDQNLCRVIDRGTLNVRRTNSLVTTIRVTKGPFTCYVMFFSLEILHTPRKGSFTIIDIYESVQRVCFLMTPLPQSIL